MMCPHPREPLPRSPATLCAPEGRVAAAGYTTTRRCPARLAECQASKREGERLGARSQHMGHVLSGDPCSPSPALPPYLAMHHARTPPGAAAAPPAWCQLSAAARPR